MKREELQKAYGELQQAIKKARYKGRRKAQKRIRLSVEAAKVLDQYIFDPEYAFEDEDE